MIRTLLVRMEPFLYLIPNGYHYVLIKLKNWITLPPFSFGVIIR